MVTKLGEKVGGFSVDNTILINFLYITSQVFFLGGVLPTISDDDDDDDDYYYYDCDDDDDDDDDHDDDNDDADDDGGSSVRSKSRS